MKRVILVALYLLTMFQIFGYTVEIEKDRFNIKSEKLDLSYSSGKIFIRVEKASYGDISSAGLLKTIADPYNSENFKPNIKEFTSKSDMTGTMFGDDAFKLFCTTSFRYGIGAFYRKNSLESFVYYARKALDESSYSKSNINMLGYDVFYYGFNYNTSNYNATLLSSIVNFNIIDSFVSFAYKGNLIDLGVKMGNIASLKARRESERLETSLEIKKNIASISFGYVHYERAIYSGETRPYEISLDYFLKLDCVVLSGRRTIKSSNKGVIENETKMEIVYKNATLIYQDGTWGLAMKFDGVSFSITDDGMSITIEDEFENGVLGTSLSIKSGEKVKVGISISN